MLQRANEYSQGNDLVGGLIRQPGGRLTLVSATPVHVSDQTAKATLYYAPYVNPYIPIHGQAGVGNYEFVSSLTDNVGLTLSLDSNAAHTGYQQSTKIFDVFVYLKGGVPVLGTGPAWTNNTTRASAISLRNGIWVNTASITLKFDTSSSTSTVAAGQATYVGSIYATANGQTGTAFKPSAAAGGGANIVGLFNAYNRVRQAALSRDSSTSWTYASATYRKADNNANNSVSWLDGLGVVPTLGHYQVAGATATVADGPAVGMLLNATSGTPNLISSCSATGTTLANNYQTVSVEEGFYPVLGFNFIQAMEASPGAVTATFNPIATQGLNVQLEY